MSEFLNAILAFPTVVFTIPLGVVIAYWLFVLLGALDIDLLGDAHLDGHGHADLDVAGHGHADVHLDGHGHVHADGHGHPGDHHAEADAGHAGGLAGLIQILGLGGVPVTLMLSVLILAAWSFCLGAVDLLGTEDWVAVVAPLASLALAVPVTAVLIRPLRRFFVSFAAPQHRDLLGKICTITTLRVDQRYGQAEVADGGAGLIVQVRSNGTDHFSRGDRALIFDYKDEVFWIAPMNQALQRDLDNLVS